MVSSPTTALWPPDDTEESMVGVDRHQFDIISCAPASMRRRIGTHAAACYPGKPSSQIMLVGCRRPDGTPYTVYPDVYVFPRPMDRGQGSYSVATDGPPMLIIEVASESTVAADLDAVRGKAWSYANAGVVEYLVLDPPGSLVPGGGQGWRLAGGVYQPWAPDATGRWQSLQLPLAFGSEGGLAAVFGPTGRHLREGEVAILHDQVALAQLETARTIARRLVRQRFGAVPALEERIASADAATLDRLLEGILTATDPAALL